MPTDTPRRAASARPTVLVVGARGIPDVEGGAEKNAERLFPLIAAAGYRVILLGLEGLVRSGEYRGVELRTAPNKRLLNTDKLFYYMHAVRVARREKPDIVHLQGLGASLFLWAYKLIGARVVVRYGSADYILGKWGALGRLGFRAAEMQTRFADAVIAVGPALVRRLAEHGISRNVHLVGNAIDGFAASVATGAAVEAADPPFILLVGRVTMQKNVDNVVRGFRRFREGGSRHRLLIAGGLDDEEYVRSLRPLLGDDVDLLGRCDRARLDELYRDCAVFINGSVHEGASNAVLEAIGRDCPVILSGIAENRDFALAEHAYFDPLDPDAIARAIAAAVARPGDFRVDRSRFMTWDQVGEKTLSIYRALLRRSA